jgi:pimeloyl-ACP methyl ester carboxylesterase
LGGEAGRLVVDTPIAGTAMFNAVVSRPQLRRYLNNAYSNDSLVTRELVEIYYATSHQGGARHAPAAFLSGHLNIDVRNALRRLSQPALLVWGEQGSIAPVEEFRGFREIKRDFEISVLSPAGDLPHDERAEDFNVILSTWLNRLSLSSALTLDMLPGTPADLQPTQQLL